MGSRDTVDIRTDEEKLHDDIGSFFADPLGHVMYSYPWDHDTSIQQVKLPKRYHDRFPNCEFGPDEWACDFLTEWGQEIKLRRFDGRTAVAPIKMSTASGHGIGKSVLSAWIIKFIMDTRPFCRGTVTANTATQLKTKTWAELGKWHRRSATAHWFEYTASRGAMSLWHKQYKEEWRCDAQTSKEENSEAFAGQHASNSTSFYLFDEASGIPDKIFDVREGGTTDGEPMTFDFGNPTRNSGRFFENTFGRHSKRYSVRSIDSRTVQITNKPLIEQWIEDFGIDSDFVKVRVLGQAPSKGSLQFIPSEDVYEAMNRELAFDPSRELVLGVDVARFGDDESVIYPRWGDDARTFAPTTKKGRYRGLRTTQLAEKVIEYVREFERMGKRVDAICVDAGGVGGGVADALVARGFNPIEVHFGSVKSLRDPKTYRFKVDELWGSVRDRLAERLCLPRQSEPTSQEIEVQLTQREFAYTLAGNKINLESKKDMKERLGAEGGSPDIADALALTEAYTGEAQKFAPGETGGRVKHDYDPLSAKD